VARPGFIIPNAADATKSSFIAEPDAGDFDILGHQTYGVWLGCDYVLNGNQFSIVSSVNVFAIQGKVYVTKIDGTAIKIPPSSSNYPRFDLVGYRLASGIPQLHIVQGLSNNLRPVFPEIPEDMLVLASAYIPAGLTNWATVTDVEEYVTDKRVFLLSGAKGVATPSEPFVQVTDPTTGQTNFTIRGGGQMLFSNGASITPEGNRRLTIIETLYAENLAGRNLNITLEGNFGGNIYAANLKWGHGPPNTSTGGSTGAIYQDQDGGHIYVKNSIGEWELLVPDGYPTGTIMSSVLGAAHPWLDGAWLLCDGRTVSQEEAGQLWTLMPSWQQDGRLVLPDLRERVLMGAKTPGLIGEMGGSNSYTLDQSHLPSHDHTVTIGSAGGHRHDVATNTAGWHGHGVNDPGHVHYPNWYPHPFTQFLSNQWGGPFGVFGRQQAWDIARHFWPDPNTEPDKGVAVGSNPGTLNGTTGITLAGAGEHAHTASTSDAAHHTHTVSVSKTGSSQSVVSNQQAYMTINYFIKN